LKAENAPRIILTSGALFIAALPYFVPMLALLYIYSATASALSGAVLGLYALVHPLLSVRGLAAWLIHVPLILLAALASVFFVMIVRLDLLISPYPLTVAGVLILLIAFARKNRKMGMVLWAAAVTIVLGIASLTGPPAVLAVTPGICWLLVERWKGVDPRHTRYLYPLALFSAVALLQAVHFYLATPEGTGERIAGQQGIRAVFSFDDRQNPLFELIGPHIRFCIPDPSGEFLVMGTRAVAEQGSKVVVLPRTTQGDSKLRWTVIEGTVGDNAAFDPITGTCFMGDQKTGKIYRLKLDPLKLVDAVSTPPVRPGLFFAWPEGKRLFYLGDTSEQIYAADLETLEILQTADAGGRNADLLWVEPSGPLLHVNQKGVISALEGPTLRRLWSTQTGGKFLMKLTVDRAGKRIFASEFLRGVVYVLDLDSGRMLDRFKVPPGIRYILYMEDLDRLIAGDYLSGKLYSLDPETGELTSLAYGGRRISSLFARNDRIYFPRLGGAFGIKTGPLLGAPVVPSTD